MNIYLEKIAKTRRIGRMAFKKLKSHDLVETALDIKGRFDDANTLHSKFKDNKPKKLKKPKNK
jgi:hypothetical protein